MLTMATALAVGAALGLWRLGGDFHRAPWMRWNPLWPLGAAAAILGGMSAGATLVVGGNPVAVIVFALASIPFWAGPGRVVELVSHLNPRLRLLHLMTWARALVQLLPAGHEPAASWRYVPYLRELDNWSHERTLRSARLLAERIRDWRVDAQVSPLEDMRREIEGARWIGPQRIDPLATRRWQLYVAYWATIADAALPRRRAALVASLESFREPVTEAFIDEVASSVAKPLSDWSWEAIESAGRALWGDGRVLVHADLDAETPSSELPVPRFATDWRATTVPLRIGRRNTATDAAVPE